jgi:asparagine synthase (glutamine-hydrolysing)
MRGIVPDGILDRTDKIGFATPQAAWLGSRSVRDWISSLFEAASESEFPFLNIDSIRRDWRFIVQGRKPIGDRVWRWVNVVKWARRWDVRCA